MFTGAAAHVFVGDLDLLVLDELDAHHLTRVLRLRPGEVVTASDGRGRWRCCRMAAGVASLRGVASGRGVAGGRGVASESGVAGERGVAGGRAGTAGGRGDTAGPLQAPGPLAADGPIETEPCPAPLVTVAFAPAKGERPEWTVQKLTEVGVDRIVPMLVSRSVVRWDGERAVRQVERWRRIARQAAMQSRRAWLPDVADLTQFQEAAQIPGAALAQAGGGSPDLCYPALLVGPEGGWTAEELSTGLPQVGLGPNILRAETAAVVAGSALVALRSGTVSPPSRAGE